MALQKDWLYRLYRLVLSCVLIPVLLFLCALAAVNTCYLSGPAKEITFFLPDSLIINILFLLVVSAVLLALRKRPKLRGVIERIETDYGLFLRVRRFLLFVLLLISMIWVLSTQYIPGADQGIIQDNVLWFHRSDYASLEASGYLARFPHQLGLFWISYLASFLFGSDNYVVFQLFNCLGLMLLYRELCVLCDQYGWKRVIQLETIILGILFFPPIMYCSFIYGTILGLYFSLLSFRLELCFFKTKKFRYAVFAACSMAVAVMLKQNSLIFVIGITIYTFIEISKKRSIRLVFAPLLLVGLCLLQGVLSKEAARIVSSEPIDEGCSPLAFIAMGLQECDKAPGWFNSYVNNSYVESGYKRELQAESAKESIYSSCKYFFSHKLDAARFFTLKLASQWNNPTFQAFWNVQVRQSVIVPSRLIYAITSVDGERIAASFLNRLQFVILCGSLLWFSFSRQRSGFLESSVPAMIFCGGFLFHVFWEAKAHYTLPYFILLLPYACFGFDQLSEICVNRDLIKRPANWMKDSDSLLSKRVSCDIICFLVSFLALAAILRQCESLFSDREKYENHFIQFSIQSELKPGVYQLSSANGQTLTCDPVSGEITLSSDGPSEICITTYCGSSHLRFVLNDQYITATGTQSGPSVILQRANHTTDQEWKIKKNQDSSWLIMKDATSCLANNETNGIVFISSATDAPECHWFITPQ